jgi:hypothetical protein
VYQQVSGLIQALDADTRNWLGTIYSPHYRGGPTYSGIDLGEETGLGLRAAIGGMQVPAYKIMNASLLRACVWAFVFSLWDRVKARLGGLDCMLLDDPQTHFDPINAENLAAAIPQMPGHGMRPLITSNDNRFVASIRDTLPDRSTASPTWHAWTLNPISSSRLTAGVSPAVEEIFERLQEWQDDENNAAKAQQFVSTVRLYVENRLWDLLATDPMIMHKPTLADLIQSVRSAHNNGEPPFEEPPFQALLSRGALRDNAPFYKIINKAHHRLHEVTPHEAGEVAEPFKEIDRLLRSCSASYARFMGRLTREDRDLFLADLPPAPAQTALNRGPVRLLGDVSARSSADVEADMDAGQVFDLDGLGAVALFGVRSPGLGAFALQGQVVVASLVSDARDGNPVVSLSGDKIYLRRLLGDRRDPSRVVLACDQTGTERVPPTLMLPRASISRPSNLADRKGAPTRLRGIGKPQVERYFNEMRSRVGQVPREIPTVTEAYDRLVTVTASLDGRSEYPAGYDPSVLGLPGQLRHYWLYQHGGELKAASLSRGSFLAEIETSPSGWNLASAGPHTASNIRRYSASCVPCGSGTLMVE